MEQNIYLSVFAQSLRSVQLFGEFLTFAGKNFRLPFPHQVQLYTAKPGAVAVLPLETWNKRFQRIVKPGAVGVPLLTGEKETVVYDVSETEQAEGTEYHVPIWEIRDAASIMEAFPAPSYPVDDWNLSVLIDSNVEDHITEFDSEYKGRFSELGLDETQQNNILRTVAQCAKATAELRCGISTDSVQTALSSVQELMASGVSANDLYVCLSYSFQNAVSAALTPIQRRALALGYVLDESRAVPVVEEISVEPAAGFARNDETDADVSPSSTETTREDFEQFLRIGPREEMAKLRIFHVLRENPDIEVCADLLKKEYNVSSFVIYQTFDDGSDGFLQETDDGLRYEKRDTGLSGSIKTPFFASWNEIVSWIQSLIGSGSYLTDEEHNTYDLLVEQGNIESIFHAPYVSEFPLPETDISPVAGQEEQADAAHDSVSPLSPTLTQEELERILLLGSNVQFGKFRIYRHIADEEHSKSENVSFLRSEYGIGGQSYTTLDGKGGMLNYSATGLTVELGEHLTKRLSWAKVAAEIRKLVRAGRYLNEEEALAFAKWERHENVLPEPSDEPSPSAPQPELQNVVRKYLYGVEDVVVIGGVRYVVSELDDTEVYLQNESFPILGKRMSREDLEKFLPESELNSRLLTEVILSDGPENVPKTPQEPSGGLDENLPDEDENASQSESEPVLEAANESAGLTGENEEAAIQLEEGSLTFRLEFCESPLVDRLAETSSYAVANAVLWGLDTLHHSYRTTRDIGDVSKVLYSLSYRLADHTPVEDRKLPYNIGEGRGSPLSVISSSLDRLLDPASRYLDSFREEDRQSIERNLRWQQKVLVPFLEESCLSLSAEEQEQVDGILKEAQEYYEDLPVIENLPEVSGPESSDPAYSYQLLSRLKQDCEYFLGEGNRDETHLWAGNIAEQISTMRMLYNSLDEPPEWLSEEEIDWYEEQMTQDPESEQVYETEDKPEPTPVEESIVSEDADDLSSESSEAPSPAPTEKAETVPLSENGGGISRLAEAENYVIEGERNFGTPSERFEGNLAAIRLLKALEAENRPATHEEQEILSRYVGWGGLSDYFREDHAGYSELKDLLSEDEYAEARGSMLTAFYTPYTVIQAIYSVLDRLGFQSGRILEPGCGIGNFFGVLPEKMRGSSLTGIELDSVSARIARLLYPSANIQHSGYEKTFLPNNYFDVVIGNVPFGNLRPHDQQYDRYHFLLHDYYFAKSLDKVRAGGIIAFITSSGSLDKRDPSVRRYISERAEFLGAVRLPNTTFSQNAGTDVSADIIFLKKREERLIQEEPEDWTYTTGHVVSVRSNYGYRGPFNYAIPLNSYFEGHPEMVLGILTGESGPYGMRLTTKPFPDRDLSEVLASALENIHGVYSEPEKALDLPDIGQRTVNEVPASDEFPNYSFSIKDGELYYRENDSMIPFSGRASDERRIRGMVELRDSAKRLLALQATGADETRIFAERISLNEKYDAFVAKHGTLNSRLNRAAFRADNSAPFVLALEKMDEKTGEVSKEDIFTRRTIQPAVPVSSVNTAYDALTLSLAEKAKVDMPYMMELYGKTEDEIYAELKGQIFLNPPHETDPSSPKYLSASEYLSGNVREKLTDAQFAARDFGGKYAVNVEALEAVQPEPLKASQIRAQLGSPWLPCKVITDFINETFELPDYTKNFFEVYHERLTDTWEIRNADRAPENAITTGKYGTSRMDALQVLVHLLNHSEIAVYDLVYRDGKDVRVKNEKETLLANSRAEDLKKAFTQWVWTDPERRRELVDYYNRTYNCFRTREYDGSYLRFEGMNPDIHLEKHQLDAVSRILMGGNVLLGHVVGAGKTLTIATAAHEGKRLGLTSKSMIVVPNNIVEQWAREYLRLYPLANILVTTENDFKKENRQKFCSRIALGDFEAIIIGQTQFERIPLSKEETRRQLEQQRNEVVEAIESAEGSLTPKRLERMRRNLDAKLEALNDTHKDDVITFEELGIDRLFVDEAHDYKNLFAKTKMQNIGGISTSEAHRSSDLYTKTRYLQEKGCSVVLATGTPLSNSIVEMFTWMRYLGADSLRQRGWENLDAWIGQFAEVTTEYELAPEGTGYRTQTRVRKFFNLPELMTLFREFGDIKTAEMLDLGTPEAVRSTIHVPPTDEQIDMVAELGDRADAVHAGSVAPTEDNMLKITSDGRKIALDPRLMDPSLPEPENSKVSYCAEKVYEIWEKTKDQKSTQFVFCDLGTPNGSTASTAQTERAPDGDPVLLNQSFSNVYAELKDKLVRLGIPADEIAFIHDAKNDVQLTELKNKFSAGLIRVLVGSTKKLGTGTNVQEKVVAMHHLDSPYRPSDLEQREGRGIRRGNENSKVEIYTYVTEKTFDAYLFQMLERKQNFIGQIYRYSVTRECEDIDPRALNFAELKALCAGNPLVREKMELDIRVQRLKLEESAYLDKKFALQDQITSSLPWTIERTKCKISEITKDIASVTEYQNGPDGKKFSITLMGRQFTEQRKATAKLEEIFKGWKGEKELEIGSYLGMALFLSADKLSAQLLIRGESTYSTSRQSSMSYLLRNIKGIPVQMRELLEQTKRELAEHENQLAIAKEEVNAPFIHAEELAAALDRQSELNAILSDDGPSERNDEERDTDLEPQQDTDTPIHGDAVKKYVAMARQILSRESPETRSNDDVNIDL